MTAIMKLEDKHSSGVYTKRPLTIVSGAGALLFDADGKSYIDCVGGQGTANLGHCHPAVAEAIAQQGHTLISLPEMFYNPIRAELAARLVSLAPVGMERVFLCNSGTEAVEAAIKFARLATGRSIVIAAMRGFHGRTFGALSATWNKKYREPFEPLVPGFVHTPYNNLERLNEMVNDQTAAVLLEVVQGEGGVYLGERDYLLGAQAMCRERGALLILDEVQTGFGRTGRMFALEHHMLEPDFLCLAKSIAGGFPMGAVLIGDRVGILPSGVHGSTFGGNPLACAAALAAIQVLKDEGLPQQAADKGEVLLTGLRKIESPVVREIRGLGLMVGIEIKHKVTLYLQALIEKGVLALPAGLNVIRLLPPLVISYSLIEQVIETLDEVLCAPVAE